MARSSTSTRTTPSSGTTPPVEDEPSRDYPDFAQNEGGFSLGGPIIKDRLHFFVNGEMTRRSAPIGLVAGESGVPFSVAEVQEVADILRNDYGYEPGALGNVDLKRESNLAFGRLDWQVSDDHRMTLRHNYVDAFDDNLTAPSRTTASAASSTGSTAPRTPPSRSSTAPSATVSSTSSASATPRVRDNRDVFDDRPSVRVDLPGSSTPAASSPAPSSSPARTGSTRTRSRSRTT